LAKLAAAVGIRVPLPLPLPLPRKRGRRRAHFGSLQPFLETNDKEKENNNHNREARVLLLRRHQTLAKGLRWEASLRSSPNKL